MVNINIIYDDMYDDTDIIAIPDELYEELDRVVKIFLRWLKDDAPKDDKDYWININGKNFSNLETVGFIKWLNNNCSKEPIKAYIVEQHVPRNPQLKSIEF